jgi:hypothetical protein
MLDVYNKRAGRSLRYLVREHSHCLDGRCRGSHIAYELYRVRLGVPPACGRHYREPASGVQENATRGD